MTSNRKERVAVWMITWNHSAYIREAIESVLAQECDFDFHLYIGVDKSDDDTLEICLEYQRHNPETITVLTESRRIGAPANSIKLYKTCLESGAEYMALLEGDDYWTDPHKLKKQVTVLDRDSSISVVCSSYWIEKSGEREIVPNIHAGEADSITFTKHENMTAWFTKTCTSVIRVSALPYSCISRYKKVFDYHLMYEALRNGNGVYLKYPTAFYRIHSGGIWAQRPAIEKTLGTYRIYRELAIFYPDDQIVTGQYWRIIRDYLISSSENNNKFTLAVISAPLHFFLLTGKLLQTFQLYRYLLR
jgi:glycosyltransferase involved in cell wall biosynthesis